MVDYARRTARDPSLRRPALKMTKEAIGDDGRKIYAATFYEAAIPPSTRMVVPVTYEARSEQSHTTALAISCGTA